jgi:hypothetical protein
VSFIVELLHIFTDGYPGHANPDIRRAFAEFQDTDSPSKVRDPASFVTPLCVLLHVNLIQYHFSSRQYRIRNMFLFKTVHC